MSSKRSKDSDVNQAVSYEHKIIIIFGSAILKLIIMGLVASQIYCDTTDPVTVASCVDFDWITFSVGYVALLSIILGVVVVRIKALDPIFAKVMKADFIVSTLFLAMVFTDASVIAPKALIWLSGIWFVAIFLAPFSKKMFLAKITQYGSLLGLGIMLGIHFIPDIPEVKNPLSMGIAVTSFLAVFGSAGTD